MADKQLHILITGESGQNRSFVIRKKTIRSTAICCASALVILILGTTMSLNLFSANRSLRHQVAALDSEIRSRTEGLNTKLAMTQEELHSNIDKKNALLEQYKSEIDKLRFQKEELLEKSVSRLDERSKIIESIIDTIGVEVKVEEDPEHSGGLFVSPDGQDNAEKLLVHTDRYLDFLMYTPLGKPLSTKISSKFGPRKDPLNSKRAFHEGLDFRGRTGDKISATAAGTVKRSAYSKGLGNYIVLNHKNGYETLFAHMSKRLVKRGDKVTRGQVIGLVGNTGRSTGSHLHYEIHHHNKSIDPMKYIKVANLSLKINN